jgi:REP-associated tyrosine transposase
MPNHVHLIVTPTYRDGLRATFAEAHPVTSVPSTLGSNGRGHLFQGRFGVVVMDEPHPLAATR